MDFRPSERAERLRAEVRAFLAEALTPEILERCHRSGVNHDPGFAKALSAGGWLALQWSPEQGGQGYDALDVLPYMEESRAANAPIFAVSTTMLVAKVIDTVGTPEQRAEIVPAAFSADVVIALAFTEPENGSDAAAAATRAVRDGDGWRINGSKIFTTNAHVADYVFMLARTDPDKPKHAGLTTFLVPMHQDGVEVRAVRTMSGERTNITFYTDVHVGDEWRIGEVDGGWAVMNVAFAAEHAASWAGDQLRLLDAFTGWARERAPDDPSVQERIGRSRTEIEVSNLLVRRAAWLRTQGEPVVGRGSMSKLFSTERLQQQADETLRLVGRDGVRAWGDPTAVAGGTVEHLVRHAAGTTIYAGTSEIQRNIIAQHVLGLPRPS